VEIGRVEIGRVEIGRVEIGRVEIGMGLRDARIPTLLKTEHCRAPQSVLARSTPDGLCGLRQERD
jgi:hypothetical protein